MKAIVVGFPKSGTTTLQKSLRSSGLRCAHQTYNDQPIGRMIYEGLYRHDDPFHGLGELDVLTQMDQCVPKERINYWPNLDFAVLHAIRRRAPDCLFILNYRAPAAIVDSIGRWRRFKDRLRDSDIPGLPAGFGEKPEDLVRWIEGHFAALRATFGNDPAFVDVDMVSDGAPKQLTAALGVEIEWWGVANASKAA